ncbi:hypothetical protein [uncultured Thiodictyon sp.]|uniref:hypothetical protein n=1 Tax=uncultured Thiodictyon sp. TaxID=1846217 RepID=UPI0025D79120|nr:hypothetical protein [uncultured Thiodictyon sp.]
MGRLLTTADALMCPHGGSVSSVCGNARVRAGGGFVLRPTDRFMIAGCPFNLSGSPHPCVSVAWQAPAGRTCAAGDRCLTTDSIGLCQAADQAPQGQVMILCTQTKASAQ